MLNVDDSRGNFREYFQQMDGDLENLLPNFPKFCVISETRSGKIIYYHLLSNLIHVFNSFLRFVSNSSSSLLSLNLSSRS